MPTSEKGGPGSNPGRRTSLGVRASPARRILVSHLRFQWTWGLTQPLALVKLEPDYYTTKLFRNAESCSLCSNQQFKNQISIPWLWYFTNCQLKIHPLPPSRMPRPINQFLTVDRFHGFPAFRFIKNAPLNNCKSKLDIKKTPSAVNSQLEAAIRLEFGNHQA